MFLENRRNIRSLGGEKECREEKHQRSHDVRTKRRRSDRPEETKGMIKKIEKE